MKSNLQNEKIIKTRNIAAMIIYGGSLLLCLFILLASYVYKPSINLNKYLDISITGSDGQGYASYSFDYEKFTRDNKLKINFVKRGIKDRPTKGVPLIEKYETQKEYDQIQCRAFLSQYVSGRFNKDNALTNGETITFFWNCDDEDAKKEGGIRLRYKDVDVKVKGLLPVPPQ